MPITRTCPECGKPAPPDETLCECGTLISSDAVVETISLATSKSTIAAVFVIALLCGLWVVSPIGGDDMATLNRKATEIRLHQCAEAVETQPNNLVLQGDMLGTTAISVPEIPSCVDAWGEKLRYRTKCESGVTAFELVSYGQDSRPGGLGPNKDLSVSRVVSEDTNGCRE